MWLPMSPTQFDGPAFFGSARHAACFCPVSSSAVANHSCGYSADTKRMSPSSPRATISRMCRTIG